MTINIIALEKDLFFSVKIRDTLRHHDMVVTTVRTLAALEQAISNNETSKPALAIINISTQGVDWEAAIRTASTHGIPVLAFGSHVDLDAQARARQAGARRVVANSKFAKDMPGLVQRTLQMPASAAAIIEEGDDDDA
jgi:DNA-binding NarL/FixJ family response regulator